MSMSKEEIIQWVKGVNSGKENPQRPSEVKKHSSPIDKDDVYTPHIAEVQQRENSKAIKNGNILSFERPNPFEDVMSIPAENTRTHSEAEIPQK